MKSVIKEKSEEQKPGTYPVLRKYHDNSFVVLFKSETEGTVVGGNHEAGIGHYSKDFYPAYGDKWLPFNKVIELSN